MMKRFAAFLMALALLMSGTSAFAVVGVDAFVLYKAHYMERFLVGDTVINTDAVICPYIKNTFY